VACDVNIDTDIEQQTFSAIPPSSSDRPASTRVVIYTIDMSGMCPADNNRSFRIQWFLDAAISNHINQSGRENVYAAHATAAAACEASHPRRLTTTTKTKLVMMRRRNSMTGSCADGEWYCLAMQ